MSEVPTGIEIPEAKPHPSFYLKFWLPIIRFFCWTFLILFGPFRRRGAYRVPATGGVLILSNHLADIDPIAVQMACKRPIHFMAKSELFEMKVLGRLIRIHRAFPVKRGEPDRAALKHAIKLLQMGEVVCVFPEGQLSESGELQELKPGIALIVRASGAQAICLGLKNTNKIMPYGSLIARPAFRWVEANWGEARQFDKSSETDEIVDWATGQLRELTS